jgi:polysaccharide export outer membrane protein
MKREELNRAVNRGLTVIVMVIAMAVGAAAQSPQAETSSAADPYFKDIYRQFYTTYKLGPADEVAIRVVGQPDYTVEKAQVSPMGRLYHPLIGDLDVAGLTIGQATERLTIEFSQYIREPRVSLSLIAANSSMIGVLGDVAHPGILARNVEADDAARRHIGFGRGDGIRQPVEHHACAPRRRRVHADL